MLKSTSEKSRPNEIDETIKETPSRKKNAHTHQMLEEEIKIM